MSRKDEFGFNLPNKKEKKERPQREKKESKPLLGEGSFLGGLSFKKSSFFGNESFFGKEKKEKLNKEKTPKRLKWWHILLIVLGAIIIVVGIIAGILIGKVSGGDIGDGGEEIPEPEGIVSSVGTFLPKDAQEYILCEYTEYYSGKTTTILQKSSNVKHNYNAYYQLISPKGVVQDRYSGEYTEEKTPDELKAEIYADVKTNYGVDDEYMATCTFVIYQPVSFTRVTISEATLTDTEVTVKYSAGAVDGEMSEEYTLTGTYTKTNNDFAFSYTNLPEDENLLRVAEKLLGNAKYENYAQYGSWVNELTFGDGYKLTLVSPVEEE